MFPVSSLDALASGQSAPVFYIPVPEGGPDGIEVAPDGAIHFNTVGAVAGLKDPAEGGMYRLTKDDFKNGNLPAPFATCVFRANVITHFGGT
jgi:sugar lactone lactonase YvrE